MQLKSTSLALFFVCCFASVSNGQATEAQKYDDCMALIPKNAEAAFDRAVAWRDLGGAAPARHCAAMALLQLGYFGEAATRLEALVQDPLLERVLKPMILQQVAEAWLGAGDAERAYAALTTAIDLRDDDPMIWQDRGIVLAEMGLYDEAIDDLSRAIVLAPNDAQPWLLRGSAYRFIEAFDLASRDIEEALRLDPADLAAYLERGNLRRLRGDNVGARKDWMIVIRTEPESPLADLARANVERMDVDGADQ